MRSSGTTGRATSSAATRPRPERSARAASPGACRPTGRLLKTVNNDSEFLPAADIQKVLDKLGFDKSKEQYFVCQSGVRTTNWIIALYAMGWPIEKLHNYDDSWIGWSKDAKLPLEKGCPDTTRRRGSSNRLTGGPGAPSRRRPRSVGPGGRRGGVPCPHRPPRTAGRSSRARGRG